jgi:hypothetical protein
VSGQYERCATESTRHGQLTLLQMSRIMLRRSRGSLTGHMRCRTALPALLTRQTWTPAMGSDMAEPLSQLVVSRRVYTVLLLGLLLPLVLSCEESASESSSARTPAHAASLRGMHANVLLLYPTWSAGLPVGSSISGTSQSPLLLLGPTELPKPKLPTCLAARCCCCSCCRHPSTDSGLLG